jgi:hypothetical protein
MWFPSEQGLIFHILIHPVRGFESISLKFLLSHVHHNTVVSDEHIISLQTSMQVLPTRVPIIILQRLEEQFPEWTEIMGTVMCLRADRTIISSYSKDLYGPKNKMFSRKLMLPFIVCGLKF